MAIVRTSKRLKTDVAVFLPDSFLYQFRLRRNDKRGDGSAGFPSQNKFMETAHASPQ